MKNIIAYVVLGAAIAVLAAMLFRSNQNNADLEVYNRQVAGALTNAERELQKSNHEIGILKSTFMTQKELAEKYKTELDRVDKEFEDFVKEHNLKISSLDKTIAKLKQQISGGSSSAEITPVAGAEDFDCSLVRESCIVSYQWQDDLDRFKLVVDNVFFGPALFTSEQYFKVTGVILEQEVGFLQVRQLSLTEITKGGDEIAKAEILESEFSYSASPPKPPVDDRFFKMQAIMLAVANIVPESGQLNFGVGLQFMQWRRLGVSAQMLFNFTDINMIAPHIGLNYKPNFFNVDLNVGIGISVGTPLLSPFQRALFAGSLVFYLNN